MSLVNRLLDTFFRALDAIDMARDRFDRVLGRAPAPDPWSSTPLSPVTPWPAVQAPTDRSQGAHTANGVVHASHAPAADDASGSVADADAPLPAASAPRRPSRAAKTGASGSAKASPARVGTRTAKDKPARSAPTKAKTSGKAASKASGTTTGKTTGKTTGNASGKSPGKASGKTATPSATKASATDTGVTKPRKAAGNNRKGSVDRSGKDLDSPRAKAIVETLKAEAGSVIADDASVEGKKVLARVLWALRAAELAGSELGLTAADASALLHLAAGMEVFSTNVTRACRDESALIEETAPDGRSKRYRLTAAGRQAASSLATRPFASA